MLRNKKTSHLWQIGLISIIGIFYFAMFSQAAINKQINYQGKLTNNSDVAVTDGNYDFIIRIYDAESGGNCLWSAQGSCVSPMARSVAVSKGIFSIMLGDTAAGDNALNLDFSSDTYYLGIKVGSDNEMTLRKRLGAVPQAFNALNVIGAGYIDIDNTLTAQNALNVNYNPASGANDAVEITYGSGGGTGTALKVTQSGTGDILNLFDGADEIFTVLNGGNVGIGTTNPNQKLDVGGTVNADSITTDTNGVTIASGGSYSGSGAVTLSSATASGLTLNSGTTGTIAIGDDSSAEAINIGTGSAVKTLIIGSTNTTSPTTIQSGTGGIDIQAAGSTVASPVTVQIGTGTGTASPAGPNLLRLDVKGETGNPTGSAGINGSMYYNSADGKFRCYENNTWKDCIGSGSGGSPGGSANDVQYNDGAGAFAGAANVEIENGYLRLPVSTIPSSVATGGLNLFGRSVGGRNMPVFIGPNGLDTTVQPSIGRNKIANWLAAGNAVTITATGAAALTATGTATAANVATTNRHTYMKRVDFLVTTAATTAVAGFRLAAAQYTRGGANAGDGGFHFICTWGPATGVGTTTNRAFVGMTSATTAPTDVQPSTLTNMMGFGWDAADTNIQFMHNDASGTATKVDMGSNFPVPTADRTKAYETIIFVPPGNTSTIGYKITDLATGNIAEGSVTTDLVPNTTLLAPRGWMSVGGTSSVIGISLANLYIETDF